MKTILFLLAGTAMVSVSTQAAVTHGKIKLPMVEGVSNHDWIFHYARGPAEQLTVLAYAQEPQSQLQFSIEWTVQYGKGRVFVSTYGHVWADQTDPKEMKCAAFQTIMVRALKWLAGRDPGDVCPQDFPATDKISLLQ